MIRNQSHSAHSVSAIPGTVLQRRGPLTYCLQVGHWQVKVHVDHLLPSRSSGQQCEGISDDLFNYLPVQRAGRSDPEVQPDQSSKTHPEQRYHKRQRKAPQRLNL